MRVQVNVNDEMVERIDYYAKLMGMSRSGLCSYFIGMGMMSIEKANTIMNEMGDAMLSNVPQLTDKK